MNWAPFLTSSLANTKVRRLEMPVGTLTLAQPNENPGAALVVVLPGFTGDAWSHQAFIASALSRGLGCLCVTPKWADTLQRIIKNSVELRDTVASQTAIWSRIHFIRGVMEWTPDLGSSGRNLYDGLNAQFL